MVSRRAFLSVLAALATSTPVFADLTINFFENASTGNTNLFFDGSLTATAFDGLTDRSAFERASFGVEPFGGNVIDIDSYPELTNAGRLKLELDATTGRFQDFAYGSTEIAITVPEYSLTGGVGFDFALLDSNFDLFVFGTNSPATLSFDQQVVESSLSFSELRIGDLVEFGAFGGAAGNGLRIETVSGDPSSSGEMNQLQQPDVLSIDAGAVRSAQTTGILLPNAHSSALRGATDTVINALHNSRIVRARSQMSNPRDFNYNSLASADRNLSRYMRFARAQGLSLQQALGLDEIPASASESASEAPLSGNLSIGKQVFGDKSVLEEPKRWEIYAVGDVGDFQQEDLSTVNRGFQTRTYAASVGAEYYVSPQLNVGAAFSYTNSETDLDGGLGDVEIEGQLGSVYATHFKDGRYLDLLYSYGDFENEVIRNTLTTAGNATGSPDSDSHTVSLHGGQNFELGEYVTGPTLGFDYTSGEIDAYSEVGGGAAAINYQDRDYQSAISSLGWQISKTKKVKSGILTLQGSAAWEHEFEPEAGNVRGALANSPFAINGVTTGGFAINSPSAAPGTDWLTLGVGSRLMTACGFDFEIDYQTQIFRQDVNAHYVGFKISGRF